MTRKLKVLCPQEYRDSFEMFMVPCNRCSAGWDRELGKCTIPTGAEHFPEVPVAEIPECPVQDRCQHQTQSSEPCAVRARGMICESALTFSGVQEAWDYPLGFNANVCATAEDLLDHVTLE